MDNATMPIPATAEPYKPRKKRKSTIPPMVTQAVIAKAMIGTSNSQISKDLGIDRATVRNILSPAEIQQNVDQVRSSVVLDRKLYKARDVIYDKLDKGSESAALAILRGFNVLQSGNQTQINVQNNGALSWLTVIQQEAEEPSK